MLTLRPYQELAKAAVYAHLRTRDDNPCVVIPTAGGKTPVIASVCKDAVGLWQGRVLVLAHVKELLEQTADKLARVCPEIRFGIYSAALNRRDVNNPVIVAGIQSVYKRACELDAFDLVIIDEAHMIPPDGDGMYQQFLTEMRTINPRVRVIGFTATPFRLKTGPICTPDGLLNHICYEVGVRELIRDGYICPLVTKAGATKVDASTLHVRGGEFLADEVEQMMDQDRIVESACQEIASYSHDRKAVLIFASGIKHGEHIARVLKQQSDITCGFVTGETPVGERDILLDDFRSGKLRFLCSVNVLTTGFDAPNIDCIALVRPTMSAGLYYQMVGRGFRLHPSKQNCLVLDFGGNVSRHGPVDLIRVPEPPGPGHGCAPVKECPQCNAYIATGYAICPKCGYLFPRERSPHEGQASEEGILTGQVTTTKRAVHDVSYSVHMKRGAGPDAPKSMRVEYKVGWNEYQSEWICFEHDGYVRHKAIHWWKCRSHEPPPDTAEEAVALAKNGHLAPTREITIRTMTGDTFPRIVGYELGDIPLPPEEPKASDFVVEFPFGHNAVAAEEEIPW